MTILSRRGPLYASVHMTRAGVLVIFAREDRPAGHRYLGHVVVDAPMHLVLDEVHALIKGA